MKTGFNRKLPLETIFHVEKTENNELIHIVKFKGCNEIDIVSTKDTNIYEPSKVIEFYQKNLMFHEIYYEDQLS